MSEQATTTMTHENSADFWDWYRQKTGTEIQEDYQKYTIPPIPYPYYPQPQPCPSCGRCPTCGRRNLAPFPPYITWSC